MSIIGEFFSFEGRVSRLGLIGRGIAVSATLIILALAVIAGGVILFRPRNLLDAYQTLIMPVAVVVGLLSIWSSFALATRRLRDMGVEPMHLTPPYVALWVVNVVLLEPLAGMDPFRFAGLERWWQLLAWGILVVLLVWPPFAAREAPPEIGQRGLGEGAYSDWRGGSKA